MKKYHILYIMLLMMTFIGLSSCSENSNTVEEYPNWKATNESEFNSVYAEAVKYIASGNDSWKVIKKWSYQDSIHNNPEDYIVAQVITKGNGTTSPIYTDSVRVHYEGRLLPSTSYPEGYVFDKSWSTDEYNPSTNVPTKLAVSNVVDGFSTALQNMHIGDRWKVYIPYQLGYGSSGSTGIPAYSTLIFDITLVSYYHVNVKVPVFNAKSTDNTWIEK